MTSTVVVGGFFGDEGKGKIISYLAIKTIQKSLSVEELVQMQVIQFMMETKSTKSECCQVDF